MSIAPRWARESAGVMRPSVVLRPVWHAAGQQPAHSQHGKIRTRMPSCDATNAPSPLMPVAIRRLVSVASDEPPWVVRPPRPLMARRALSVASSEFA
jgi:hypothetical protein